jgi:response regulator of citrate/malate metabolism
MLKQTLNNLLIVEDNLFIGEKISKSVKELTDVRDVYITASLQEAFSFMSTIGFKLIILDLMLPDGNGIELLKKIKEEQFETKVLVFSISTELERISLKYGAFAFFDKAKDFDKLIEAVQNTLKRK